MVFRGKEITFNAIEFGLSNGDRKKTTSMFNNPNIAGTRTFRDNLQKYPLVNSKLRLIGLIVSLKILKGTKIKVLTKKIIIDIFIKNMYFIYLYDFSANILIRHKTIFLLSIISHKSGNTFQLQTHKDQQTNAKQEKYTALS